MRKISLMVLATFLLAIQGGSQTKGNREEHDNGKLFSTSQCIAFGGAGIIQGDLFISTLERHNALDLGSKRIWTGKEATNKEIVIVFDNKVISTEVPPKDFDLSKATIVSFENDKIRFYNYCDMSGGYYKRRKEALK